MRTTKAEELGTGGEKKDCLLGLFQQSFRINSKIRFDLRKLVWALASITVCDDLHYASKTCINL